MDDMIDFTQGSLDRAVFSSSTMAEWVAALFATIDGMPVPPRPADTPAEIPTIGRDHLGFYACLVDACVSARLRETEFSQPTLEIMNEAVRYADRMAENLIEVAGGGCAPSYD